jgi:ABC-type transport system substrate-binding protein
MYAGSENRVGLLAIETNGHYYMGFNFTGDSVFNDKDVRLAWDLAIDREALAISLYPGDDVNMILPTSYFHRTVVGHDPTTAKAEFNPAKAKELLANSSYDGRVIGFFIAGNTSVHEQISMALLDMLSAVGFNLDVTMELTANFLTRQSQGDYEALLSNLSFPGGLPIRQLSRIVTNMDKANYQNEEMFKHINGFLSEVDPAKREEHARLASRIMYEEKGPFINVIYRPAIYPINHGITGFAFSSDGIANHSRIDWDPSKLP